MVSFWSTSTRIKLAALILLEEVVRTGAFPVVRMIPATSAPATTAGHCEDAGLKRSRCRRRPHTVAMAATAAPRYGPPIDDDDRKKKSAAAATARRGKQGQDFRRLLDQVLNVQDPNHIPSLLTKNVELILSLSSSEDGVRLVESVLKEERAKGERGDPEAVAQAVDLILTFAEQFVDQAVGLEDQNKRLLGKIIKTVSKQDQTAAVREQELDALLQREQEHLTAGFLRHLDNECTRIARAPVVTPESTRLLQILRLVQTRVVEEMGHELGEAAQVLGQLIGYTSPAERQAVLETGLAVRGPDFARELLALTEEALEGFRKVIGGADPELVECVKQIDHRLRRYLDTHP